MKFLYTLCLLSCFILVEPVTAQLSGPLQDRFNTLQQNSVTSLDAFGDTLWIGPGLNRIIENNPDIFVPQQADSVFDGRGRAFSMEVKQDTVLAGLGFNATIGGSSVQTAQGYYRSLDGGSAWQFIPFPLDDRPEPGTCTATSVGPPCDIEFTYGDNTYIRTRITVPQQSPPFEVDFKGDTIFSVNWASGVIRSLDGGNTWERLILPPSNRRELTPENSYNWLSQAGSGNTVSRYDPRSDNNLLGFGLLIDSQDRVWVGTAAGINISENALTAPFEEIEWQRTPFEDRVDGLLGSWIVNIREQPGTGTIWLSTWNASNNPNDRFGLVTTDDGGQTFRHYLEGERVNDIGFFNGTVYAATDRGLFLSGDNGQSWRHIHQIKSPNSFIREGANYFSIAATTDRVWVGTADGIASSADNGQSWQIWRVDVPLKGGNIYQPDADNVRTYAYPNPYSPSQHGIVRIKFEVDTPGAATLRIYDFGMNTVYEERSGSISSQGSYEFSWDGKTNSGRLVAGGTYIYVIDGPGKSVDGKILLLD